MIDQLANRIALKIKETSPEETASLEVMKFALIGILHNGITISVALIAGLAVGKFQEVLLAVFSFMILRLVSGGIHFKSALACSLFSFTLFIAIPFIDLSSAMIYVFTSLSLLLCIFYAPSNVKEHLRVPEKYYVVFKALSILVVSSNLLFVSPVICLGFISQSLLLITFNKKEVSTLE